MAPTQSKQESIPVRINSHQISALVGCPKLNKFEQVPSEGHQMSLAREG